MLFGKSMKQISDHSKTVNLEKTRISGPAAPGYISLRLNRTEWKSNPDWEIDVYPDHLFNLPIKKVSTVVFFFFHSLYLVLAYLN